MVKVVLFVRRKPGWTVEESSLRYEEGHAPLARRVLPLLQAFAQSDEGKVLARDEEGFMDRTTMRYIVVEEHVSPAPAPS
jgi:hypothetical protein